MNFLGRAKRFLQDIGSEPESKTQYFNVLCASGHRVRGERTEGYQALRCPACGEGVFVLPRSPLPEPPAPPRPTAVRRGMGDDWVEEGPVELTDPARVSVEIDAGDTGADDAEIIWDDPPVETAPRTGGNHRAGRAKQSGGAPADPAAASTVKPVRPDRARTAKSGPRDNSAPVAGPPPPGASVRHREKSQRATTPEDERDASDQAGDGRRVHAGRKSRGSSHGDVAPVLDEPGPAKRVWSRKRTLHRALFVVVPLLIVLTVGWRIRQNQRAKYPSIAELGRTEGIPALDEGNFDKAFQLLAAAKTAVDALGGAVAGADEIKQAADEAAHFVHLIPQSLEEMLDEAGQKGPDAWASRFDSVYKGGSVIIDSWVRAEPDPAAGSGYDLVYRVLPPGQPSNFLDGAGSRPDRVGVIDLRGFELFELAQPSAGNRVTFAAQLASFAYDPAIELYVIRLKPNSGIFITHTKALESIGWRNASEIRGKEQP